MPFQHFPHFGFSIGSVPPRTDRNVEIVQGKSLAVHDNAVSSHLFEPGSYVFIVIIFDVPVMVSGANNQRCAFNQSGKVFLYDHDLCVEIKKTGDVQHVSSKDSEIEVTTLSSQPIKLL